MLNFEKPLKSAREEYTKRLNELSIKKDQEHMTQKIF